MDGASDLKRRYLLRRDTHVFFENFAPFFTEPLANQRRPPFIYYSDVLANESRACGGACSQESEDDHNEGVETMKMSEEGCDNKCQKKPAREVPEVAHASMEDFARD